MKEIEILLNKSIKYKNSIIQKKFHSKKNTVAYVIFNNKPRILKWFAPGFRNQMNNEFHVLKKGSSKLKIPIAYEKDNINNVIIMNYIPGKNLCDIINDDNENSENKEKIIIKLAFWFKRFHEFYKTNNQNYIRGDSNLRNFIFTDNIWGLDFEEFRIGNIDEDIANICTSILTTDPKYTNEKYTLCRLFIKSYFKNLLINYERLSKEITYSILNTMIQRGITLTNKKADEITEKIFLKVKI